MNHKNLWLALAALFAFSFPAHLHARANKEKLATPVYEDQTNQSEFSSVNVGSTTAVKLWTPNASRGAREDRKLRIQNTGANSLHIATYTIKMQDGFLCATCTANTFVIPTTNYLTLSPKTTFYGIYDAGASSQGVHMQVDFHDPSALDASGN